MKRAISLFLASLILINFRLLPLSAYGAECDEADKLFSSVYNVTFDVGEKGTAKVTQKVSLKNLSGDCFVSEYSLRVNSPKVKSISGSDALGSLKINLKKEAKSSSIVARLNDEVTGLGKSVSFTLNYTLVDLASKDGQVWNLTIPKIATGEKVSDFNLTVLVPKSFGSPFSLNPEPKSQKVSGERRVLTFGKKAAITQGVSASFGQEQQISFDFKIPLENKQVISKKYLIPLPPDTDRQQVLIQSLEPRPRRIFIDEKGNYLADYSVSGRDFLEVQVKGTVRIVNEKRKLFSAVDFNQEKIDDFTNESKYVQSQERAVQEKANELKKASEIYKFVVGQLAYDEKKVNDGSDERSGAAASLSLGEGATGFDFVDLFVAIARAAKIPAREVIGIAISDNKSLKPTFVSDPLNTKKLHVWAQFYDLEKKVWVDVDPTWGSTSGIDYFGKNSSDRFALLFTESESGIENLKNLTLIPENIKVSYNSKKVDFVSDLDLQIDADQAVAGFPADLKVTVKNKNGLAVTTGKLFLDVSGLKLAGESESSTGVIMPFEEKKFKFKVRGGSFFGKTQGLIKAKLEAGAGDQTKIVTSEKPIVVASLFSLGLQQISLLIIVVLLIVGIFIPRFVNKK